MRLSEAQKEEMRRVIRLWETTPAPCGIPHSYAELYNPCMPEREDDWLVCMLCFMRQHLQIENKAG